MKKPSQMTAVLSAWDKDEMLARFAHLLDEAGVRIVASSGTKKFLNRISSMEIVDTSEYTKIKPVLDHRVVTLCPQIHGGLLAEWKHMKELAELGWPEIDLVMVTFYPLMKKMEEGAGDVEINDTVDIGGPAMVRSACKGGRIVVTDPWDFEWVGHKIKTSDLSQRDILWLQAVAAAKVTQYQATEALYRVRRLR